MHRLLTGGTTFQFKYCEFAFLVQSIDIGFCLALPLLKYRQQTGIFEQDPKNVLCNEFFKILLELAEARKVLESNWVDLVEFAVG